MKREARQHGMVRTHRVLPPPWNPKPEPRSFRRLDSNPVAGLFSNVPSKPSNHSKFTGKCGRPHCPECHLNPVRKSKDKTKGTQKFRRRPGLKFSGFSATGFLEHLCSVHEEDEIDDHVNDGDDDDYDHGSTCAHVDDDDNHFMANFWSLHEKEIKELVDDDDNYFMANFLSLHEKEIKELVVDDDDNNYFMVNFWSLHEKEIEELVDDDDNHFMANFWSLYEKEIEELVDDDGKIDSEYDDDDDMSFCDVGLMLDLTEEDEGWCLLREM